MWLGLRVIVHCRFDICTHVHVNPHTQEAKPSSHECPSVHVQYNMHADCNEDQF